MQRWLCPNSDAARPIPLVSDSPRGLDGYTERVYADHISSLSRN